ncbi:MAG: phosphotransferase [Xanthomonadales bacterium]|nr:phosphotransferase [Xanthomonadales bacterium]
MSKEPVQATIQRILTCASPAFSAEKAKRIAMEHFGIRALASPLVSERDQNFRLDADDGRRFVLKVSNHAEQEQVVDFQNLALLHIAERDPGLPVPRVIATTAGCRHCIVGHGGQRHFVRVLSWMDGQVLSGVPSDAVLTERMGRMLARLGRALRGFEHPGSNPFSLWDMKRAGGLRALLPCIEDRRLRPLITGVLDHFEQNVSPLLDTLRNQVIYNDMNLDNVLLDESKPRCISGLIDFGDLVSSPLVMDPAIAAAYQLSAGEDPLAGALPLIAGYHAVYPLHDHELRLLPDLIMTRLVTSLLIGSFRATLFPDNRDYLLTSFIPAQNALFALSRQNRDAAAERILDNCSKVSI